MRYTTHRISIVALIVLAVLPTLALAQVNFGSAVNKARNVADATNARSAELQEQVESALCTRLDTLLVQQSQRFSAKEDAVSLVQNRREQSWNTRVESREQSLDEHRDTWDKNRLQQFTRLRARANTEIQKQAVEAFIQNVEDAIEIRRAAVDAALATYRKGLEDLLAERKSITAAATDEYKSEIAVALDAAKIDCVSGVNASAVKSTLLDAFAAAKRTLQIALSDLRASSDDLQQLSEARRSAVVAAGEAYTSTLAQATKTLKQQFGEQSND
ncbi:MAG: hypothetical protein H6760_02795 [Candidatus Nomurabacteria bacterium]|nr:MAG: hypothetical protein H6760_02795 [Candidatus Nomurabacteria bacterium]